MKLFICVFALFLVQINGNNVSPLYGQCGGQGYNGPTSCASGSCTYSNPWYSQCLPSNNNNNNNNNNAQTTTTAATTTATATTAATNTISGGSSSSSVSGHFSACEFQYGLDWDDVNNNVGNLANFDYLTIWLDTIQGNNGIGGSTTWNNYYQGAMLRACVQHNLAAFFYGYVIAFEARIQQGIQDCNVGSPSLCVAGADYIRQNWKHITDTYASNAYNIANTIGSSDIDVFMLVEPDFMQYAYQFGAGQGGGGYLSGTQMRQLLDDIYGNVSQSLPNVKFLFDISPWFSLSTYSAWWSNFKSAKYIWGLSTSGGESTPQSSTIKDNPGITWAQAHQLTGLPIFGDCGYGVGGARDGSCSQWQGNEAARAADGVVAVSMGNFAYNPTARPTINC